MTLETAKIPYVVYRTTATQTQAIGAVVNVILYDGTSTYDPGEGLIIAADPDRAYKIGDIYSAPSTTDSSGAS